MAEGRRKVYHETFSDPYSVIYLIVAIGIDVYICIYRYTYTYTYTYQGPSHIDPLVLTCSRYARDTRRARSGGSVGTSGRHPISIIDQRSSTNAAAGNCT
jgi:hypothetical protein